MQTALSCVLALKCTREHVCIVRLSVCALCAHLGVSIAACVLHVLCLPLQIHSPGSVSRKEPDPGAHHPDAWLASSRIWREDSPAADGEQGLDTLRSVVAPVHSDHRSSVQTLAKLQLSLAPLTALR